MLSTSPTHDHVLQNAAQGSEPHPPRIGDCCNAKDLRYRRSDNLQDDFHDSEDSDEDVSLTSKRSPREGEDRHRGRG